MILGIDVVETNSKTEIIRNFRPLFLERFVVRRTMYVVIAMHLGCSVVKSIHVHFDSALKYVEKHHHNNDLVQVQFVEEYYPEEGPPLRDVYESILGYKKRPDTHILDTNEQVKLQEESHKDWEEKMKKQYKTPKHRKKQKTSSKRYFVLQSNSKNKK